MSVDVESLVRLVPEEIVPGDSTGQKSLELHLERYRFAGRHVRAGKLLDVACGVGYGTRLMADECGEQLTALGIDVAEEAIVYASEHYAQPGISFRAANAMDFEDPDGFDSVVSLETIEHLPDPVEFVDRIVGLLRPRGILVVSVPITPSVDVNPFHLHDFTEVSFRRLFTQHGLVEVAALRQTQAFRLSSVMRKQERRMKEIRPNLASYYARHPHALLRRLWSTLRYGFSNNYLTVAWKKME